jgi:hypothetical protein
MWANVFDACKMFTFIGMDPPSLIVIDQCYEWCFKEETKAVCVEGRRCNISS